MLVLTQRQIPLQETKQSWSLQPGVTMASCYCSKHTNSKASRIIPVHISYILHWDFKSFGSQNLLNKFRQMVAFTANQFLCWNFHITDHSATGSISFTKSTPALQGEDKKQIPRMSRHWEHSVLSCFEEPRIIMKKLSISHSLT